MSWEKWVECLEYLSEPFEAFSEVRGVGDLVGVEQLELALEPDMGIPGRDLVDG